RRGAQPPRNPHLPHIAIGNSAVDAMAALIDYLTDSPTVPGDDESENAKEGQRRALGRLVQAIEYDALDRYNQPGGRIAFDDEVHSAWFHPVNRGSYWEILEARDPDKKPEDKQAAIDAPLQALLDALNTRQRELDVAELQFAGTQRQLYECAWKLWRLSSDPKPANAAALESAQATARNALAPTAKAQQAARDAAAEVRDTAQAKVAAAVKTANAAVAPRPGLELRQAPGTRFYQPADPVVLVYGMKRSLTKHGEDGRFTGDGKLTCRVTEQTLSAFQFEARTLTRAHVEEAFSIGTIAANLPRRLAAPAVNLLVEWLLLDPLAQSDLAEKSGIAASVLGAAQGIVWADFTDLAIPPEQMVNVAGFTGTRPSPLAVDRWAQPWAPLYLSWRVAWYPSAPGKSATEALRRWDFNGLEYDWVGIADSGNDDAFTLQGRSLLSATTAQTTLDALKDLEEAAKKTGAGPTAAQVDELRAQLESIDLMAQTLTGFHDLLSRRNPYFQVPPATLGTALGSADPALLEGVNNAAPMPFDNPGRHDFQAFRAGHFRLLRLWVVDAFGQVFDPVLERLQSPESFVPLRGSGLAIQLNGNPSFTTARAQRKDTQQLQLPPRLLQAARLEARFERDDDPSLPALCGWLLPNHFDNSLAVYDRASELLGALLQSGSAEAPVLRWDPSVTGPVSVPSPSLIQDAQLRGFVEGLAAAPRPAGAFNDLIETIDRTLWGIDPLGQRGGNLSVLIGRPIAVVRMSLQLELEREPLTDPSWNAAAGDSRELAKAQFPVAIGHDELHDDGTLGYFTDGYGTFRALHAFKADSSYVVAANVREDVRLSPNWPRRAVTSPPAWITVLCDPRGSIHLRTGILPTAVLRLPRELGERPLRRLDVTFRVGPLLHEPEGLEMPLPAEISGGWSWIQRSGINGLVESPVADASHHARMSDTPIHIREGWLRLSDAIGRNEEK
ncbi:MAG: hypothetical protein NTW28_36755, partial [Candidatus Solibacter sp.]|nr:hypothetical protein [Candidatus Solibacter sp.]